MNRRAFLQSVALAPIAAAIPAPGIAGIDHLHGQTVQAYYEAAFAAAELAYRDVLIFGRGVIHYPEFGMGLPRCVAWFEGELEPAGSVTLRGCTPVAVDDFSEFLSTTIPAEPA